jgi:hypothetical protein
VEVLQWVEKRHDNDMAEKIEKAERVVQQDIFRRNFRRHHYVPGYTSWVVRSEEKRFTERATLEREETRRCGGECKKKRPSYHACARLPCFLF